MRTVETMYVTATDTKPGHIVAMSSDAMGGTDAIECEPLQGCDDDVTVHLVAALKLAYPALDLVERVHSAGGTTIDVAYPYDDSEVMDTASGYSFELLDPAEYAEWAVTE